MNRFLTGWIVVSAEAWRAILRSDVWQAAGIEEIVPTPADPGVSVAESNGTYLVRATDQLSFRLVLRAGPVEAGAWSASTVLIGEQDAVLDVTLSDRMLPSDVAPVLARVLAEAVAEIERGVDPTPEGLKVFRPAANPRATVEQVVEDRGDRAELVLRGEEMRAVRWWQFIHAATLRAEGAKLVTAMGIDPAQRPAELLRKLLTEQERKLAELLESRRSLKDERAPLRSYEAKALRGQVVAAALIGAATAAATANPLAGVALFVPTAISAVAGAVAERWLDGRKEIGRQPAYDANKEQRDRDYPGMRMLLDEVVEQSPVNAKLPRAAKQRDYLIRYAVPTLTAAAVAGALTLVGVPAWTTVVVIGFSSAAKAIGERIVDAKKLDYRLARVDRSLRERLADPRSLDNQLLAGFADLYFRLDRALAILTGQPDPGPVAFDAGGSLIIADDKDGTPPYLLHLGVQGIDNVSSSARRLVISKPADPGAPDNDPTELARHISAEVEVLLNMVGPSLPGMVTGALGEKIFLNIEEATADRQKNRDAEVREAIQGLRSTAELRPWYQALNDRVRLVEAIAGLAPELGTRAGDRAGYPSEPQLPGGPRPVGQSSRWVYAIPVAAASFGGLVGVVGLDLLLDLPLVSVAMTAAGAIGAVIGTPVARHAFRRAELNRKDEVAAALGKQSAPDLKRVLEQRAIARYLVTQLTIRAERYLAVAGQAPPAIASAVTNRLDQLRLAVNQAVRELAAQPPGKKELFERLVALEKLLETVEALDLHQRHGTPDSVALLQQELDQRLEEASDYWRRFGSPDGLPLPPITPTRSAIAQALNPRPQPDPGQGTVHSPEVTGTRYVPDGRRPEEGQLTRDEVLDAAVHAQDGDFGGLINGDPVRSGDVIVVESAAHGRQHFRVEVGPVRRRRMAATDLHVGTTPDQAHVVRVAPGVRGDQLTRVWVHEISHTLHAMEASAAGRVQRVRSRVSTAVEDACVGAQYNEHRLLARQWAAAEAEAARTGRPEDREAEQELRRDLEGLARSIDRHGHPPPTPPWQVVPPAAAQEPIRLELRAVTDRLRELRKHVAAKEKASRAARKAGDKAIRKARAAERRKDQGRHARIRASRHDATTQYDLARWHQQRAGAYQEAVTQAKQVQAKIESLLAAGADTADQELVALRDAYEQALAALAPPDIALPSMLPTGNLPRLTALADQLNRELTRLGVDHQFTAESLQRRLSAEFGQLVTPEGAVIRVGKGHPADLRIVLSVSQLEEVLDPPAKPSEMIIGVMPQGGRRIGTTAASRVGLTASQSLRTLTRLVADQIPTLGALGEVVTARLEGTFNRGLGVNGTAAVFAQDGAVEDNRGESLLYRGQGRWRAEIRMPAAGHWQPVGELAQGNEVGEVSGWVSHAYTVPPATELVSSGRRPGGRLPDAMITSITGLQGLNDRVTSAFRGRLRGLGEHAHSVRDQIQAAITQDLPGRLAESTERPVIRPLLAGGKPVGHLEIKTTVRYEAVELVGAATTAHWQERVRVGFTTVSGQESFSTSVEGKGVGEFGGPGSTDADSAAYVAEAGVGRSSARGEAQNAASTGIQVGVQRYVGPTQAYRMVFEHEVTLVLDGHGPGTVHGKSSGLVRLRVSDAYRHGLPVDKAALNRPQPTEAPERVLKLPEWAKPGQGSGPALVQEVTGGRQALAGIVARLADRGFLPPLHPDGTVDTDRLTTDPLERHGQLLNLEELHAQLSPQRLETGYDTAVQSGLLVTLTRPRTGLPTESVTFRIRLEQKAAATPVGLTADETMVTLNIGSDGAGRVGSRSKTWPWSVKPFGLKEEATATDDGGSAGITVGRNPFGRVLGFLTGGTINQVTLVESTSPLAVFEIPHQVVVTEVDAGTEHPVFDGPGTARILFDSDLLPYQDGAFETGPVNESFGAKILQRATVLALQVSELAADLPPALSRDPAARQQVEGLLDPRNLMAHPEWLGGTTYRTGSVVAGRGPGSERYTVEVTGSVRDAVLVAVTDGVAGDINFAMSSSGSFAGWSTGGSASAAQSASAEDQAGGLSASGGLSTSAGRTEQQISGVERLEIQTGRHYVFAADAELRLSVREAAVEVADDAAPGGPGSSRARVHLQLPEHDALRFYARGELALPLHQVADAVHRYVTGDLTLDRQAASSLIRAYRKDLGAPGAVRPALARRHDAKRLFTKLARQFEGSAPLGRADDPSTVRLAALLDHAEDLAQTQPRLPVPPQYQSGLGSSLIESVDLGEKSGSPVLDRIEALLRDNLGVLPETDAVLAEALFADFAGKRWWGRIDDMLAPGGFTRSYPVRRPGTLVGERVTVRVRATLDTDGVDLGDSKDTVSIVQRYLYAERLRSAAAGQSLGAGLEVTPDTGVTMSGRTDRSGSTSLTQAEQQTRLERLATFDGVKRLGRGLKLEFEVVHSPAPAPTSGRIRRALQPDLDTETRGVRRATDDLSGQLVQLIPNGFLTPLNPTGQTSPGPAQPPPAYFVEGVAANDSKRLLDAVRKGLAHHQLLGPDGVLFHQAELEAQFSPSVLNANFSAFASEHGARIIRLEVPGQAARVVDVVIRAVPSGLRQVSEVAEGAELGEVNRSQETVASTVTSGRLLPAGAGAANALPVPGARAAVSAGEQLADSVTDVRGVRRERSRFENGSLVTVGADIEYEVTLVPVQVLGPRPAQPDRPGRPHHLPPVPGEVYLSGHHHEFISKGSGP